MSSFLRSLKRLGRALVSIVLAGSAAYIAKDEKLILFAPVLQALGKYLRDKLGLKFIPF